MTSARSIELARKGRALYEQKLRTRLEATNRGDFVAVEPESGDYFLGKTLSEAIGAARAAHPDRLSYAVHVGHKTTVDIGVLVA
jgi:hypothetical protein